MPDFRVADTAPEHPKLRAAGLAAAGLWSLAGAFAMRELTDGWVPEYWVGTWPAGRKAAKALVAVGLWQEEKRGDLRGFRFHDWTDYQRSADQLAIERSTVATRKALYNDAELVAFVKGRDQDQCRYCGRSVSWSNRRGPGGATFDHVIPIPAGGTNTEDNVVVACRGCNSGKRSRTPEQARMTLLPPPGRRNGTNSRTDASQIRPIPPPPGPPPGPERGQVGGEASGTERERPRNGPRPRCPTHQEWTADQRIPPCGACADARRDAEQQAADLAESEHAIRAAWRAEVDACPDCDENGKRELDDGRLVRHHDPAEVPT